LRGRVGRQRREQLPGRVGVRQRRLVQAHAGRLLEAQEQLDALEASEGQFPGQRIVEANRAPEPFRIQLGYETSDDVEDQAGVERTRRDGHLPQILERS
jgi:hypothetical protein